MRGCGSETEGVKMPAEDYLTLEDFQLWLGFSVFREGIGSFERAQSKLLVQ
jgi:hypothetical protein